MIGRLWRRRAPDPQERLDLLADGRLANKTRLVIRVDGAVLLDSTLAHLALACMGKPMDLLGGRGIGVVDAEIPVRVSIEPDPLRGGP